MKIKFLIAEDIRPEASGKMVILGLFPDDIIIFVKPVSPENITPEKPHVIEKLYILLNVTNLSEKTHKFKAKIIDPDGKPYQENIELGEAFIKSGSSHTLLIKLQPFVVQTFGIYTCVFNVNNKSFKFPFEIREQ